MILCFTYYELYLRVLPSAKSVTEPAEEEPEPIIVSKDKENMNDFWSGICLVMDEREAWRNPNTR